MASLEYLNNQLNECNALINKINGIRDELTKAYNSLENATNIGNYYSIDNLSADNNDIIRQRNNILAINNNLGNNISSINTTISSIKNQITEEENRIRREEEEAERIAREEANKKAQEIQTPVANTNIPSAPAVNNAPAKAPSAPKQEPKKTLTYYEQMKASEKERALEASKRH